jgi:RNA polymerase sigma-70 factor (ECF subfamily)
MERYCDGDGDAASELYRLTSGRVLAYLIRLAGNRSTAEDILQQTFLKVHRARSAYNRGANPIPWIFAIAHRTFIDEARRQKRARVRISRTGDDLPEVTADLSGRSKENALPETDSELTDSLVAALRLLPQSQREAIVLTKLEGKSLAAAAAIVGSTTGAMKLRAHRGYVALRQILSKTA